MPCAYSEESTCHAFYSDVLTTAGIGDRFAKVSVHFEVVLDCLAPMINHITDIIGTLPALPRSQQHPSAPSAACFGLCLIISPLHRSSRSSFHCSPGSSLHCLCMSAVGSLLLINISCPLHIIVNDRVFCLRFAETKIRILSAKTLETPETLARTRNTRNTSAHYFFECSECPLAALNSSRPPILRPRLL